jgi:hypothetical protein
MSNVRPHNGDHAMIEATLLISILLAIGVGFLLWRSYLPSYASKKGENLATQEDIGAITKEVEEVKALFATELKAIEQQNALVLEQLRSRQQLRLVASEKRLAVHQEAFALWRKLVLKAHDDDVVPLVAECQRWWDANCLFLTSAAREAFNTAYFAASAQRAFVRNHASADLVESNWSKVTSAGEVIVAAVDLPSLGEREGRDAAAQSAA